MRLAHGAEAVVAKVGPRAVLLLSHPVQTEQIPGRVAGAEFADDLRKAAVEVERSTVLLEIV